jgi:parallel beta-helix repeat protein
MKALYYWISVSTLRLHSLILFTVVAALNAFPVSGANFYSGVSPSNVPWTNGIVPYEFTNTLTAAQKQTYLDGLREWELAANVKFVPHTDQSRWVLFTYDVNGPDDVSAGYNPQVVSVNSLSRAQVGHEMGHSFGFTHENIRSDATNFVLVVTNNIFNEPANIVWFTIDPTSVTNGNYDYESVMHLGWDFDSLQPGALATQQPKPPNFPRYRFRMGNYALSPSDRAALLYLYGPPAVPLTNVVFTTADSGPGSLRAAMYYVSDHPGSSVVFNIPTNDPGYSNGMFNIHLTGHLPTIASDGMVIDGSTQPGFSGKPLIIVDASQIIPETFTSDTLLIYSANNQIKNISLQGFDWNGVTLLYADATNNTISGCWIGLDSNGINAAPNASQGILIDGGASRNIIGGTNALARNVISGNKQYGIYLTNTTGNVVLGNYIGTDANGTNAVPNWSGGAILRAGTSSNLIGGTNALARNIFSGNTNAGVWFVGASSNVVAGNFFGLNAAGNAALPNTFVGMYLLNGSQRNLLAGNVFSGNPSEGLRIAEVGTSFNTVQGNYFGTDASGLKVVANGYAGATIFSGATSNLIGRTSASTRNIFGGGFYGFVAADPGTSGNVIQGNYIGLGADGTTKVPNYYGVLFSNGATNNTLGGASAGARNVISGNNGSGIDISFSASRNFIQGNFIGTDISGLDFEPNGAEGIYLHDGASGNLIGGTTVGAGNVISGNILRGIYAYGTNTSYNLIQGNLIGLAADGSSILDNGWDGVVFFNGASSNIVGLALDGSGAGNKIAFNEFTGVYVGSDNSDDSVGNTIRGNSIFSNGGLGIDLAGGAEDFFSVTANDGGDADTGPNRLQNYPTITNVTAIASSTTISGTFNSTPNRSFIIDIYRGTAAESSGYGEGQFYVGSVIVTNDGSGDSTFALSAAGNFVGQHFSATATDRATGDTSEFSASVLATNGPAPPSFVAPITMTSTGFVATLSLAVGQSYRVQAATNLGANPIGWTDLTNFTASATNFIFLDRSATNLPQRFYRVVSP